MNMDKFKVYNLIDSLSGAFNGSVEGLEDNIIEGVKGFLSPEAAYFYLDTPQMDVKEKYVGDLTHKDVFMKYKEQLRSMEIDSAEYALSSGDRPVISCAALRQPRGTFGVLMVMTARNHPLRHIIRQVLELYQSNILLALAITPVNQAVELPAILDQLYPELEMLGVNWLLALDESQSDEAYWRDREGFKNLDLNNNLKSIVDLPDGRVENKITEDVLDELPGIEKYNRIITNGFNLGRQSFKFLLSGNFENDDVIISKFRSRLNDIVKPSSYDEIVDAFSKLKKDHKLIVKGERIAAILETAVALNHEINNPLTAVLGNTQLLLLQKDTLPEAVVAKINTIEKSAIRIREVTQKLMKIVEPITTNYTNNLDMLDIEKSASPPKDD